MTENSLSAECGREAVLTVLLYRGPAITSARVLRYDRIVYEMTINDQSSRLGTSSESIYDHRVKIDITKLFIELGTVTSETFGHYIITACNKYGCSNFSTDINAFNSSYGIYRSKILLCSSERLHSYYYI